MQACPRPFQQQQQHIPRPHLLLLVGAQVSHCLLQLVSQGSQPPLQPCQLLVGATQGGRQLHQQAAQAAIAVRCNVLYASRLAGPLLLGFGAARRRILANLLFALVSPACISWHLPPRL